MMPPTNIVKADEDEEVLVREQMWATYVFAWVAAFTDAIGFIVLQQLGASYMSGNSMTLGVAFGRREWGSVVNHGLPILSFSTGILLGVLVLRLAKQQRIRCSFSLIFALEALCVFAFLLVGIHFLHGGIINASQPGAFYFCVFLLTLAMGLQTATLRKIGEQSVRTTFITGVISDLAEAFLNYLFWLFGHLKERRYKEIVNASLQQTSLRQFLLLGGIWLSYIFGAICGSIVERQLSLSALIFPIAILLVLIIIDIVRPFEGFCGQVYFVRE